MRPAAYTVGNHFFDCVLSVDGTSHIRQIHPENGIVTLCKASKYAMAMQYRFLVYSIIQKGAGFRLDSIAFFADLQNRCRSFFPVLQSLTNRRKGAYNTDYLFALRHRPASSGGDRANGAGRAKGSVPGRRIGGSRMLHNASVGQQQVP